VAEGALRVLCALAACAIPCAEGVSRALFAPLARAESALALWLRPDAPPAPLLAASQLFALLVAVPEARAMLHAHLEAPAPADAPEPAHAAAMSIITTTSGGGGGGSSSSPPESLLLRALLLLDASPPAPIPARRVALAGMLTLASVGWDGWAGAAIASRTASRLCAAALAGLKREPNAGQSSPATGCLRLLCMMLVEKDTGVGQTSLEELGRDAGSVQRALACAAAACDSTDANTRKLGRILADSVIRENRKATTTGQQELGM